MGKLYSEADKVYTNNSMLDEVIHNLKLILQGIILKDQQEAEDNETSESIANSDLYLAIMDGTVLFSEFVYDGEIMRRMNAYIIDNDIDLEPFTDEEITEYVIDNDAIPKEYRSILLSLASQDFLDSYVELNNYYRRLNGQKDIGDPDFFVDISYIPSQYYQQFIPDTILAEYDSTGKSTNQIKSDYREMAKEYLLATAITDFTSYQISLLDSTGIMDNILNDNPKVYYLKFLGAKKIPIYRARKAEIFEILYMPDCESQIRTRYQDIFDTLRVMYLKRYYSLAYKFENPYYDKFFAILLICQTANDIIVEIPEYFISRTVFDTRTVQTILEANGVKYFPEIPLKYQIALVRSLNGLIKYKSTTKNIFDIAKKVFNLKNVEVSKYYLLKRRNIDPNEVIPFDINGGYAEDPIRWDEEHEADGGWPGTGEHGETLVIYDGGTPSKSTNFLTNADLNKMYSLYFVRVPIGDTLDNYLRNTVHHTPYDTITNNDPYWDGPYDHEYVKYEILKKDFTTQSTKYLSLTSGYSSNDYIFQIVYFLNMIMNTSADSEFLNLEIPVISQSATFNLHDLIILLYCLAFQYFDPTTDDIILLHNRDPKSHTEVDPVPIIGDYDPYELGDWDMDGGPAMDREAYYNADGGSYKNSKYKYVNCNAGGPRNSTVPVDFPETSEIEFDEDATDTDYDGLYPFEYLEIEEIDGGTPFTEVLDRDMVLDGGYVVNSYLYHGEDSGILDDPCQYYKEDTDTFDFPEIDLSDRILGFNAEANLAELQDALNKVRMPRLQWLRGYNITEILPSYTQTINMYEGKALFPQEGVVGQLYEDTTTGKYYFWNSTGYTLVRTVYSKGIQDFMTPTDGKYYTIEELTTIYHNNKEIYDNLIQEIRDCDTERDLWILTYVYEYLFTMKWNLDYYKLPSTGKMATRYSEFLKEKDGILYAFYEKLISETNIDTKQYNMSTYLDQVIESINQYLSTDGLDYIFYFVPTVSLGVVLKYVSLLLNFFKSYKAYILDVSSTMRFESTLDNAITERDTLYYKGFFYTKGDPLSLYDNYNIDSTLIKEDTAFLDNQDDRIFIKEQWKRRWFDCNGGDVDQNYWFDIDANDGSNYPGYKWPYDSYYVLDGGGPEDACPTEQQWATLHSPHFRGRPTVPIPPLSDESDRIAPTVYVNDKINLSLTESEF